MTTPRGNFLDHPVSDLETSSFARAYGLTLADAGDGPADPRLLGLRRRTYRPRALPELAEVEVLVAPTGLVEVAGLWLSRAWASDRASLPAAVGIYTAFLVDAIGEVLPRDAQAIGDFFAVSFEQLKSFDEFLTAFPFVPRDGVGAANEVFLARRLDASLPLRASTATLIVRNDVSSGRMYVGIATATAAFDLAAMLFHAPTSFTRAGDRAGVLGWQAPDVETTPFGRRFSLELDRAAPPQGRIARRYYGFPRIPGSARVEVLVEPTRGIAGVLLRIDQDWVERSDGNFFSALDVLSAFVAEGAGDTPDARTRVEIGSFFSVSSDDPDLFKRVHAALPFVARGETGEGTAVFLGQSDAAVPFLDESRCGLVLHEGTAGWLDCLFYCTELWEEIGSPAVAPPTTD